MKTTKFFLIAATMVAGLSALTGCESNIEPEKQEVVEGPVLLMAEGFNSSTSTKTSVSGNSVQWENGDPIFLNGSQYDVTISGDKAYVNASLTSPVYGYYGFSESPVNNQSVTIPAAYACSINEAGRQVIALPMAAYSESAGKTIKFKHLTAAVNVTIWNATASTLYIDTVTITAVEYRLNGACTLNLSADDYGISASTSSAAENRTVTVSFATPMAIEPGETNAKSVQVPILPIGADDITINVASHNAHYDGVSVTNQTHTFNYKASAAALGRNYMLSAKVKMDPRSANVSSNGVFSVSATKAVYFSQGNLQFCANVTSAGNPPYTRGWRFASTDLALSNNNMFISESYAGWIDLFSYGTSGYNNGQTAYQPWSTDESQNYPSDFPYYTHNLTGNADWGYNAISNGGNTENSGWRTPTAEEWDYLVNQRPGNRFAPARIWYEDEYVNGYILLPDNWDTSIYTLNDINGLPESHTGASYTNNTIETFTVWSTVFAPNGAIFLANNKSRDGTTVQQNVAGWFWTSSWGRPGSYDQPMLLNTQTMNPLHTSLHVSRCSYGLAVRLVRNAN